MSLESKEDRGIGALYGLAVGDALGTTVEFSARGTFAPVRDMIGGGPFRLRPGGWTDDTSMALCLADALIAGRGELDPALLLRLFVRWWREGYASHTDDCFDIGTATRKALLTFEATGSTTNNTDPAMQANGSIMRLAPAVICAPDREVATKLSIAQGTTTHAAKVPSDCCRELGGLLWDLIESGDRDLIGRHYSARSRASVVSSGHAPATLDAARWAVATTKDFRSAVLKAVNLGDDADTVGAVAGQIAGALYGISAIPPEWREKLAWSDWIEMRSRELWQVRLARIEGRRDGAQSST